MHYERLRARVQTTMKAVPEGVAFVVLNDNGTWTARYGIPQKQVIFKTERKACDFIRTHTSPETPIIVMDIRRE